MVTDEAIEKIKVMITSGALQGGDRLPREADLAAGLGLSRSSLREAVRALSLVNILDLRRGDGPYVISLEPATAMAAERITDAESDGLRVLLDSIDPGPAAEELVASDLHDTQD